MYEVIDLHAAKSHPTRARELESAFEALAKDHDARYVLIRMTAGENSGWSWQGSLHHDIAGALRSFRFLAEKAAEFFAKNPSNEKILASISKHLATLERLKTNFFDRIFNDVNAR